MKIRVAFLILTLSFLSNSKQAYAAYSIKGKVNLKGEWQHQIFLSTIDKLDDYYNSSADLIINVATVKEDGSFVLTGDNLPERNQFYRLYVIKEQQSEFNACLYMVGEEHNFIHLILNNQSSLEITADFKQFAPFGDYTIKGDEQNLLMKNLARIIYPSYMFYEIKFPSELQFSQDKLNRDLIHFADTCSNSLVALAAINSTDYDSYFKTSKQQYHTILGKLEEEIPSHPYTKNYARKLKYYSGDDESTKAFWLWPILALLLFGASLYLLYQNRSLKAKLLKLNSKNKQVDLSILTPQEEKICDLIISGKSNQEIANELFVELSTVKSHINKLYAKLKVKNRKELKNLMPNS